MNWCDTRQRTERPVDNSGIVAAAGSALAIGIIDKLESYSPTVDTPTERHDP